MKHVEERPVADISVHTVPVPGFPHKSITVRTNNDLIRELRGLSKPL